MTSLHKIAPVPFQLIQHQEDLQLLAEEIRKAKQVAIDTEADSLHHYYEKICLIQVSVQESHYVVDPLSDIDVAPLLESIRQKSLLLHGADYDMHMFNRSYGFLPEGPVFDTMLAAQLLGLPKLGLSSLVQAYCGVTLPKEGQKWDWSKRPLEPRKLEYAVNDTRYLGELAEKLRESLVEKERLDWHTQTCRQMLDAARSPRRRDPEREWRLKGSSRLSHRGLAVLKTLWHWREEQAQSADLPPFKICNNGLLVEMAQWMEKHEGKPLAQFDKLPRNLKGKKRLDQLQKILKGIERLMPEDYPQKRLKKTPRPEISARAERQMKQLARERDKIARHLQVPAPVLAPKAMIRDAALARPQSAEALEQATGMLPWQRDLLAGVWLPHLQ